VYEIFFVRKRFYTSLLRDKENLCEKKIRSVDNFCARNDENQINFSFL